MGEALGGGWSGRRGELQGKAGPLVAAVYSETSCFLPIKWVGGLLQHNPLPGLPSFPPCSVSTLLFPSPAMLAPSVIPRHVNRSQSSRADGFNPQVFSSDILLFPPQRQ